MHSKLGVKRKGKGGKEKEEEEWRKEKGKKNC